MASHLKKFFLSKFFLLYQVCQKFRQKILKKNTILSRMPLSPNPGSKFSGIFKEMTKESFATKSRRLTQALVLSIALNIGLMASLIYTSLKTPPLSDTIALENEQMIEGTPFSDTNLEVLSYYFAMSFDQLIQQLRDETLLEEGYRKRDLALSCLVAFHHFNLEKSLSGMLLERRQKTFVNQHGGESIGITLFPGLEDESYVAILNYIHNEKWPLTSAGLFKEIKHRTAIVPPSLKEAFFLTPEFHALTVLFNRSDFTIDQEDLFQMAIEGEWETLSCFATQNRFSDDSRRKLLLSYIQNRSKIATMLLLSMEREFLIKKLEDAKLIQLISTIEEKTPEVDLLLKDLLVSARSDKLRKRAAQKLYEFAGEVLPNPFHYELVLARFFQERAPVATQTRVHIVKRGDTLWHLSRQYGVKLSQLKEVNELGEGHNLKLGMQLIIPNE